MRKKKRKNRGCFPFLVLLVGLSVLIWKYRGILNTPVETILWTMRTDHESMNLQELMEERKEVDESEVQSKFYYSQMEDEGKLIYRELLWGLREGASDIFIHSGDAGLISETLDGVLADNPDLFWMDGSGEILSRENSSVYSPNYNCTAEERSRKQGEIDQAASECLGGLPDGASEYDRLKYIYDYIVNTTDYNTSAKDSQNIYSALVNRESVCAGYSKMLQYLLEKLGMECIYVMGTAGNQESHAWNIVKCEGSYYQVDVTWGDPVFMAAEGEEIPPELTIDYDYLCCTDEEIRRNHAPDTRYDYPACTAVDCNYYRRNGLYYEEYDEQVFWQAMNDSISKGESQTVFKFADAGLYRQAETVIMDDMIVRAASNLAEIYGLEKVRYAYTANEQMNKIVLLWNYE
ncbi:MAG: hypothetical protein HFH53_09020 [Hespellia sp.]|nr:hypothetical protein [Hespellia sp.]